MPSTSSETLGTRLLCPLGTCMTRDNMCLYKLFSMLIDSDNRNNLNVYLRGCLHDTGATFVPGRDEKLHRVYIKPCLLGCESFSAIKLMKLQLILQTDFTPKRVVVSRLHDTVAKSRAGVKFSPRCENRGELTPGRLAPA